MTVIAIFGAASGIAEQTARALADSSASFFLVARRQDLDKLERAAADLKVRGAASVVTAEYDFNELDGLQSLVDQAKSHFGGIDLALVSYGTLTKQAIADKDISYVAKEFMTNFVSPACLSQLIANHMVERGHGLLAVITSVAGDRGRGSNYAYGAAKGGLGFFLQGLRHRVARHKIGILDIRPGLVDTPMTRDIPKGGPLWAKPEIVGRTIAQAMRSGRQGRLYVPGFWRWIMFVVRSVPAFLFHKTNL